MFLEEHDELNPLKPNDLYSRRTAPLTSKRSILYIYSTNISTEYFKHSIYSPFFPSKYSLFHNCNVFGSCIIHILYTGVLKKNNSDVKRLRMNKKLSCEKQIVKWTQRYRKIEIRRGLKYYDRFKLNLIL